MNELTKHSFEIDGINYLVTVFSKKNLNVNTLDFEIILKDQDSNRIIFKSTSGDWESAKYLVGSCFDKLGIMLNIDPNLVERKRDGFLTN